MSFILSFLKPFNLTIKTFKDYFAKLRLPKYVLPIALTLSLAIIITSVLLLTKGKEEKKEGVLPPVLIVEKPSVKEEISQPPPSEPPVEQPQEIILQIFSDPPQAKVFVDGVEKGETPLFIPGLKKSEITLRLEKDGYVPVTRKITIEPSEGDKRIEVNLRKIEAITMNVNFLSEPEGARVFINGRLVGTTPLNSYPLSYGTYQITMEKDGYKTKYDEIKIFKGGKQTVSFILEPIQKIEEKRKPVEGEIVDMSEKVSGAKKTSGEYPTLPPNFRKKGKFSVTLSFLVDENGDVREIIIEKSSGEPELDRASIKALQSWKFTPPTLEGVRVKVRRKQIFTFVQE